MSNLIRHKGIEHGVLSDAPFIGARICAIQCHRNCPGCFNQVMLEEPYVSEFMDCIYTKIVGNKLNEGVIFGGLEWSEQPEELKAMVAEAARRNLKVMIYTHLELVHFLRLFSIFRDYKDVYAKCGEYRDDDSHYYDSEHDVTLASSNQIIVKLSDLR